MFVHPEPTPKIFKSKYQCNICFKTYTNSNSYTCERCDWNMCEKCFKRINISVYNILAAQLINIANENKYELKKFNEISENIKNEVDYHNHNHFLEKINRDDYDCALCHNSYKNKIAFFCKECGYSICPGCYNI